MSESKFINLREINFRAERQRYTRKISQKPKNYYLHLKNKLTRPPVSNGMSMNSSEFTQPIQEVWLRVSQLQRSLHEFSQSQHQMEGFASTVQELNCFLEMLQSAGEEMQNQLSATYQELQTVRSTCVQLESQLNPIQPSESQPRNLSQQESEDRFHNFVERASDWIWEVNEQYCFTYVNLKVREILGYEPEEVLGKNQFDFMPPAEAFRVANAFGPVTAKSLPFSCFENTSLHKNGTSVILETSGVPIFDALGKFRGYRGITRDVTLRKQTEESLRESEARFRAIFEREAIGVILANLDGRIVAVNPKFQEMLGYSSEELRDQLFTELTDPEDLEKDWKFYRKLVAGQLDSYQVEKRYYRKNGQVAWGALTISIIRTGEIPQFSIVTIQNITERKLMEESLRESECRFRQIAENIDEVFWLFDAKANQVLYINPVYERVWRRPCQSIYDNPFSWLEVVHIEDRQQVIDCLESLMLEGGEYEYRIQPINGSIRWIRDRAFPVRDSEGKVSRIIRISDDITERKLSQQALQRSESKFRRLFESNVVGVAFANINGQITEANNLFLQMVAYSREEMQAGLLRWDKITPPNYRFLDEIALAQQAANGVAVPYEKEYIRKDQTSIPVMVGRALLENSEDWEVVFALDITEQVRTEKFQRRLLAAVEAATDGMGILNTAGEFIYLNKAHAKVYGYHNVEQLTGQKWHVLYEPDEIHYIEQEIFPTLAKAGEWQGETQGKKQDGTRFPCEISLTLIEKNRMICVCRDISERKRVEAALQQSEERFRQLAEHIDEVFWMCSVEGDQILYISPAYEKIWGRSCQSLYENQDAWLQGIHPQDRERVISALKTQVRGDYDVKYRILRPTGEVRWIHDRAFPIQDETGQIYRLAGIAQDITEHRQMEVALRTSEEQSRRIFEQFPIGIVLFCTQTQNFVKVNPAICTLLGYSESELIQRNFSEITYPEDLTKNVKTREKLYQGEALSFTEEIRCIKKNGELLWTNLTLTTLCDSDGKIVYEMGMVEDISQRKKSEEEKQLLHTMAKAVFESEDFHSALSMTLQKVCEATHWDFGEAWVPRADGRVLISSSAWYSRDRRLERFRLGSKNLIFAPGVGLPGRVWLSKQPEWRQDISQDAEDIYMRGQLAKKVGLKSALGIPILTLDGVLAVFVFYMFESRPEDARLIELIAASTELGLLIQRKQAEEKIRSDLLKERELNELKSRFVSMTNHEFRTPLGTILSSSELLENYRHKWSDEKQLTHLRRIQVAVKQLTEMLNNILTIGKAEAGKLEFNPAPLNLGEFCRQLVEEFQLSTGPQTTLVFHQETSQEPQGVVEVSPCLDAHLLRYTLGNLLSNAIKYSLTSGVVELSLTCHEDRAVFVVKDQGIGIPPVDQKRLFESFHRASNVGNIQGTGLGLAIVKNCVDLHGGTITVESEVGAGTTFTVMLPFTCL